MNNTVEAVKYGIETLKVTPDAMFSLIESSNGYTGDDYNRWLANEIIKIAEKDGVGYSQLLVKKFSIIQSMSEESDATIRLEVLDKFKELIGCDNLYSIGFEFLGTPIEDVDWFNGVDYDSLNSYFVEELPNDVKEAIVENNDIAFITRLSSSSCSKNCDMFKSAKELSISCKSEGSLLLYRMCSIIDTFNSSKNFKFAFLCNTDFLSSKENEGILKYFSQYFNLEGIVLKSNELFEDSYLSNSFAFVVCTPRDVGSDLQDGIELKTNEGMKLYSRSTKSMLEKLIEDSEGISTMGDDLVGYMNVSRANNLYLTDEADSKARYSIPITMENLEEVVLYYCISKSLGFFGFSSEITKIMTGHSMYDKLYYSCVPLFLFDDENAISGIQQSELALNLLEKGEIYFSYESKELVSTCKGFMDFLKESSGLSAEEDFASIRREANHPELNELYISSLRNLKDYIKALYREVE